MSDKEKGRRPTEKEREVEFSTHESPQQQGDGDPGPNINESPENAQQSDESSTHGTAGRPRS